MSKEKKEKLESLSEKLYKNGAEDKTSGNKSRSVKRKVKTEVDSKNSSLNMKATSQRSSRGGKRSRNKEEFKETEKDTNSKDAECLDTSLSEYFSASKDVIPDQNKDGRKRLKKEKTKCNSSIASKVRTLKNSVGSEEGSDEEFEADTVTYKAPVGRRASSSKKRSVGKFKLAKINDEVSDIKADIDSSGPAKSVDLNDEGENILSNEKNEEISKKTTKRKRKGNDLFAANETDTDLKIKKPKRQIEKMSRCKQSKKSDNGDTKSEKINRKALPEKVKGNKKSLSKKQDTDDVVNIVQQNEGRKNINKNTDKMVRNENNESSDEEMMDVEDPEKPTSVTMVTSGLPKSMDHSDAMAVLMHMEGPKQHYLVDKPSTSKAAVVENMSDDDAADKIVGVDDTDEESEWEDVEDHHGNSPKKSQLPSGPVEITLDAPVIYKKRKKGEFDLQAYFRRQINRFKREVAMDIHKVHLLCLLARCQYLNNLCKDETVQAQALSITMVTKELKLPPIKSCTESHVIKVLSWIKAEKHYLAEVMEDSLKEVSSQLKITLICIILLRQVGFLTRLVSSLQPVAFKETSSKSNTSRKGKSRKSSTEKAHKKSENKNSTSKPESKKSAKNKNSKDKPEKLKTEKAKTVIDADKVLNSEGKEIDAGKKPVKRQSSDRKCSRMSVKAYKDDADSDVISDDDNDEDFIPVDGDDEDRKKTNKEKRKKTEKEKIKRETNDSLKEENISDDDFAEDSIIIRSQQLKKEPSKKNRRALSTDDDDDNCGVDNWAEVYIEKEQKWICVDCVTIQLKKPYEIENKATQPVTYVVGITQESYMRDITARYASQWLTETRKLRVDNEWWDETLETYKCPDKERDRIEDQELNSHLQQRPLPTSVGAFKSHPLYALKRHLLKFEALYPDTAVPVGYIRGEPVYARECVHTLHSRENWLKEGRAVRVGEEPYKFVKSRAKWNRPKEDPEAKDLELFGRWQTELYIPPPAVDGKVPRNAHGNVEMFLPSMLPAGTVHLKIPALNKVAKKLDIDCAPAMVGWDHHCGFSHPLMDGWIVCEEYKDILLAAWDEEQEIIREKEQQKREKRVYENWRKLIRGMLIKERLKKRFDLEERPVTETSQQNKTDAGTSQTNKSETVGVSVPTEKATDKNHAWPQSRMTGNQHTLCTVEEI